ncbi:XkdW family protein [Clostridium thailandense]|uniref:XkdW family protein n=1 Tax=Clostridium thailandense TaxID=2794346 RepID=UPI003989513E
MGKFIDINIVNKIQKEREDDNTLQGLGQQLVQEKLKNIQKDSVINGLGQQVADLKLQVIKLHGGTN